MYQPFQSDKRYESIKFGGTSVGSANSILSVKRIVEAINEPLIVVVSALGGITDKLINTSKMAAAGDSSYVKRVFVRLSIVMWK